MPIFAASLIQVFALCRRLVNLQGGCARIFLVFMSLPYGLYQPEGSILMVFLFLRFDKLVNKEYISHFRIDTSCDWSKQWFPVLPLLYYPSP